MKDQWFTHLPDPTRPEKRRKVKRIGYDNIYKAIIDFYRDRYHMDITLGELFEDWAKFRRDETRRTIENDPYALAIRLDFNLFARIGELAALRWENVDFDKRTVYICHQLIYEPELNDDMTFTRKKQVTKDYLKDCTSHGYRTEHLTNEALEVLTKAR